MRSLRVVYVTTLVVASLALPAVAAAAPSVSVNPTGQLGPEGATAVFFVTASCDPGATNAVISVSIAQSTGWRLVQASGGSGSTFGGTPLVCDGNPQLVPITVRVSTVPVPMPLKVGKVAVTASVSEFGPTGFLSATVGPLEGVLKK